MNKIKKEIKDVLSAYIKMEREALCGDIIPEHTFSESYYKRINEIINQTEEKQKAYRSISIRRILAVAAILALIAALTFTVIAVGDRFSLFKSTDLGGDIAYTTTAGNLYLEEHLLEPSFIPEGFKKGAKTVCGDGFKIEYSDGDAYWTYFQEYAGAQLSISTEGCDFYKTENIGPYTVHIRQYYCRYTQMYWATDKYVFVLCFNDLATAQYADEIILSLQSSEE